MKMTHRDLALLNSFQVWAIMYLDRHGITATPHGNAISIYGEIVYSVEGVHAGIEYHKKA